VVGLSFLFLLADTSAAAVSARLTCEETTRQPKKAVPAPLPCLDMTLGTICMEAPSTRIERFGALRLQ
jgi:hypothetical protein